MPNFFKFKFSELTVYFCGLLLSILTVLGMLVMIKFALPSQLYKSMASLSTLMLLTIIVSVMSSFYYLSDNKITVIYNKKTKKIKQVIKSIDGCNSVLVNPIAVNFFTHKVDEFIKVEDIEKLFIINTNEHLKRIKVQTKITKQISDIDALIKNKDINIDEEITSEWAKMSTYDFKNGVDLTPEHKKLFAEIIKNKYELSGFDVSSIKIKIDVVEDNWAEPLNTDAAGGLEVATDSIKVDRRQGKRYIKLFS